MYSTSNILAVGHSSSRTKGTASKGDVSNVILLVLDNVNPILRRLYMNLSLMTNESRLLLNLVHYSSYILSNQKNGCRGDPLFLD